MKNHELRVFINCIVWMLLDSFQTSWKIIHPCKVQTTCHFFRLSGSIVGPLFFHHFWSCTPWHDEKPVPRNSYDLQGFNARIFFQSMIQLCCGLTFFGIRADANEKLEETWPPPLLSVKSPQFHFSRFCHSKEFNPLIFCGAFPRMQLMLRSSRFPHWYSLKWHTQGSWIQDTPWIWIRMGFAPMCSLRFQSLVGGWTNSFDKIF